MYDKRMREKGQIVIILLLVMVVSLAIGLSIAGRSITEISTANISENSSRAFSAAEAGINRLLNQKSLGTGTTSTSIGPADLTNQAAASATWKNNLPAAGQAMEYPALVNKDQNGVAQFWLANPNVAGIPTEGYNSSTFNLYFGAVSGSGNPAVSYTDTSQYPAVEIDVISYKGSSFYSQRFYYDTHTNPSARDNFLPCPSLTPPPINTTMSPDTTAQRSFLCEASITLDYPVDSSNYPVMARVRLLYSSFSHPIAIQPISPSSLPVQLDVFTSSGNSGAASRNLTVYQQAKVLPFFLDYAVFSRGDVFK